MTQYYALDGLSGSGVITQADCNGGVRLVGVHNGSHDSTESPPPIKKFKGGGADADSASESTSHLSGSLHGHTAYCYITIACTSPEIIAFVNRDSPTKAGNLK